MCCDGFFYFPALAMLESKVTPVLLPAKSTSWIEPFCSTTCPFCDFLAEVFHLSAGACYFFSVPDELNLGIAAIGLALDGVIASGNGCTI